MRKLLSFILTGVWLGVFLGILGSTAQAAVLVNPPSTTISTSSIAAAGAVLKTNNGSDFSSTSTTVTNLGAAGIALNNAFTGNNTFGGLTNILLLSNINFFPSPTQLAAGAICGNTTGVTEVGACQNDIYAAAGSLGEETIIGPYTYLSSTWTTGIVCGTIGKWCSIRGAGAATQMNYGGAVGTAAITIDYGPGPNPSSTTVTQTQNEALGDLTLIGTNTTTTNPQVGVQNGVSNGAGQTLETGLNIRGFGLGIDNATNTYDWSVSYTILRANGQNFQQNPGSNSGESISVSYVWAVDQVGSALNCFVLATSSVENANIIALTTDNCQFIDNGGNQVYVTGGESENTNGGDGSYIQVVQANDQFGNLVINGWQFHNDGTSTSTTWSSLIKLGSNAFISGISVSKSANASSVPQVFTNYGGSGNDSAVYCDITSVGTNGFTAMGSFPYNNIPAGNYTGCFQMKQNGYPFGWITTGGAGNNVLYADNGPAMTIGIPAGGSNTAGQEFSLGGASRTGTSTFNEFGSLTLALNISGTSSTVCSGPDQLVNGNVFYNFSGASNSTSTFASVSNVIGNRLCGFTNTGTGNDDLVASSTDFFRMPNGVTTTEYTLKPGGTIMLEAEGANNAWDVISKTPQAYLTPTISGAIVGIGCDTATTTVDLWVGTSSVNSFQVFPTTPANNTVGVTWSTYLSAPGIVTTQACSDATVTPTASKATFDVQ